jgi:hypothetical protein
LRHFATELHEGATASVAQQWLNFTKAGARPDAVETPADQKRFAASIREYWPPDTLSTKEPA